jgi:hypothetical protein
MQAFKELFKNISRRIDLSNKPLVLGRWKVHNDTTTQFKTADMTNEDHCGVCYHMRYDYLNKSKNVTKNHD